MEFNSSTQRILIEEVTQASKNLKQVIRGLSIGTLIKSIRRQLGMSQKVLAKRSKVPQPTISRVEKGQRDVSLSTLSKILGALSCDLVIAPVLRESIDTLRRKQARKLAEKQIHYLKGTMSLEEQRPDSRFIEELLKQEEEHLLRGPNFKLWDE